MIPPSLSSEGNRLLAAGQLPEAISAFQVALKTDPKDARSLLGLAKAHLALSQKNEALTALNRLLEVRPEHPEGRSHKALILAERGEAAGIADLENLAKDRRAGFEEHYNYGLYLVSAKQDDKAMKEFEAAGRIEARDVRPQLRMGEIALRRKDALAAINYFQKATQLANATDAAPWVLLARTYQQAGHGAQAATTFFEAIQRRREDEALYEEAYKACLAVEEFDSALKTVLLARERKPNDPRYVKWQEEVTLKLKNKPKKGERKSSYDEGDASAIDVEAEVNKANEILSRNPPTKPEVAKQVIVILDKALRVNPQHGDGLALMGLCQYLIGEWDQAEAFGKKALAAAEKAKNPVWKENAELVLSNMARKRAEKAAKEKGGGKAGSKPAPAKR